MVHNPFYHLRVINFLLLFIVLFTSTQAALVWPSRLGRSPTHGSEIPTLLRSNSASSSPRSAESNKFVHVLPGVIGGLLSFTALIFVIIRVVRKRHQNQCTDSITPNSSSGLSRTPSHILLRETPHPSYQSRYHNVPPPSIYSPVLTVPIRPISRTSNHHHHHHHNQPKQRAPISLSDAQLLIKGLKAKNRRKPQIDTRDIVCSICLDDLDQTTSSKQVTLPCDHVYHIHCTLTWFRKGAPVCPYCNYDLAPYIIELRNRQKEQKESESDGPISGSSCSSSSSWTSWGVDSGAQWLWTWWYGEDGADRNQS